MVFETPLGTMEASELDRRIDTSLKERDMIATPSLDLYIAALESDATTLMRRIGFDDRIGRKRIADLIDDMYLTELMVIVQLVRWYEIGLLKPEEIDVQHPTVLMIDLRRRIAASPKTYVVSPVLLDTLGQMMAWWSKNTITSAWRSVKAHVRLADEPASGLCNALAEFLWQVRDVLVATGSNPNQINEVQS